MTQTTFGKPKAKGFVGSDYNSEYINADPRLAHEDIEFGQKMSSNSDGTVSPIGTIKSTLELNTALTTSNILAFTLKTYNVLTKVETISSISGTFDTSHAITMAALVTLIKTKTGVKSTTSYTGNVLTILVDTNYILEVSSEAVAGGTAVTIAKTNFDTRAGAGFALHVHKQPFEDAGVLVSRYKANEIVNNATVCRPIVATPTGFNNTDTLYYVGYGTTRGQIKNTVSNNGIACGSDVKHYQDGVLGDVGVVSFRLNNIG